MRTRKSTSGWRAAAGVALLGAAVGCGGPGSYVCAEAGECRNGGEIGRCEPDGFCSFPDLDCPSGWRYAEYSGPRAGECVPEDGPPDTDGTTQAPTTSSTSPGSTQSPPDDSSTGGSTQDVDASSGESAAPSSSEGSGSSSDTMTAPGPDLALHLELEDASFAASIADSGPHDLSVSCNACPVAVPGRFGQGASFAGADQCIVVPHDAVFDDLTALTISVWVRPTDDVVTTNRMIVDKPLGEMGNNTFELYYFDAVANDGQLQTRFAASDGPSAATATDPELASVGGDWIHLAATWDGSDIRLWVDGLEVAASPMPAIAIDDNAVLVGCDDDPDGPEHDNVFEGLLDDVRIYREALSAEQIATLTAGGEPT